jgi:hypothetical protein
VRRCESVRCSPWGAFGCAALIHLLLSRVAVFPVVL